MLFKILLIVAIGFCITQITHQEAKVVKVMPIIPLCQNIIGYINSARSKRGVRNLKVSTLLNNFSQEQASTEAKNKCLEVSSKEALDGLKVNAYGQNVAFLRLKNGQSTKGLAASLVRRWLQGKGVQGKGHKKKLVKRQFQLRWLWICCW